MNAVVNNKFVALNSKIQIIEYKVFFKYVSLTSVIGVMIGKEGPTI